MGKPLLRWGILGAANIARKNWKGIWNSGNGCVTAVASRDRERSRKFIEECQVQAAFPTPPQALGSYEGLLASPEVEAVYIPLPTGLRAHWVKQAAKAGKHVVCEKPCAVGVAELAEMLEVCRQNHVQFMDGVMFIHSRRLARLREALDDGETVGTLRRISSAFTFCAPESFFGQNIRTDSELEPDGCLGDLGWYCIRFSLWAMRWALPLRVTAHTLSGFKRSANASPVPTEFSAELFFANGITSSFYCSFLTENEQWARVSGSRGCVRVPDFVLPFSGSQTAFESDAPLFTENGCDFSMAARRRRWAVREHSHSHPTAQESQLFRRFGKQVQSGKLNPLWPEMALKTQQVMQACRESALAGGKPIALAAAD